MVQILSKPTTILPIKPSPLATFVVALILCILGFYALHYPDSALSSSSQNASRSQHIFLSSSSNSTVSSYLRALTLHPHLAGTKLATDTTRYVFDHFRDVGLQTHSVSYKALLSYPVQSALSAHFSDGSFSELPLSELGRSDRSGHDLVPPYHAYSPSGSVYAKAVFINYGREEDYRQLGSMGVNVSGCIVIARKSDILTRGAVVETAEVHGAAAVLIYTDADSFRKGFERGNVMRGIGDPLSPGWGGVDSGESLDLDDSEVLKRFPKIPSMPLSAETAETILYSLEGHRVPQEWRNNLRSEVRHVGPGPTMLNFTYQGEKKVATIQNVFAIIEGSEEPDRYVLLGNHRDAWTYGAVDPSSGTAALLDIARRYSSLLHLGWTPRRTIILCSWDAEEFGMIGSTEWVEENLVNLRSKAVAYLNVDCAAQGPGFFAGSTPQLDNLLLEIMKEVKDPDFGSTVFASWAMNGGGSNIQRLSGVHSDFAPFVHHAGVPSIDMFYGKDFPVYHTAFDSYDWMTKYGDPFFHRHVAVVDTWGLLGLRLADDHVIPFNYLPYVDQLQVYMNKLSSILLNQHIALNPLSEAIQEFNSAAKEVDDELQKLRLQETVGPCIDLKRRALNDRLMLAEKGFLDPDGLNGSQWFKHLVFGPPNDHGSKLDIFPGVADSITWSRRMSEKEGQATIQHEIWRVARAIQRAALALRGDLI